MKHFIHKVDNSIVILKHKPIPPVPEMHPEEIPEK